jgi:hypothetical protein
VTSPGPALGKIRVHWTGKLWRPINLIWEFGIVKLKLRSRKIKLRMGSGYAFSELINSSHLVGQSIDQDLACQLTKLTKA